ncbi:type I restriction endonuclease subunit R [Amycolatopsis sp. NPDC049688]|uniref:type I restriction endonuclease subunit R n=1 Tax=Amycolatopsis sp. NPDC049688 TaxID=3154733 RepID=UPI003412AD1B
MSRIGFSEAQWEQLTCDYLAENEWRYLPGTKIAPGAENGRTSWDDLVLKDRALGRMRALNPQVPPEFLEQALAEIVQPESQDPISENKRLHDVLVYGYRKISYVDSDGVEQTPTIRLVSHRPEENDFLAVNQVTLKSLEHERRFDIVCFLNGFPVAIFELKQAGAEKADLDDAHAQLGTYLREFPMAFRFAVLTVISDGIAARYGTPFTPLNHFSPWNVDDDGKPVDFEAETVDGQPLLEIEVLIDGLFNAERFLQLQRNFVAFDEGADGYEKRIAKPHQYFAVTKAIGTTVDAATSNGKAGVVWHTQGSGKSMVMELYTHLVGTQPALKNPTVVVVTDRKELDGQLFGTFSRSLLLDEKPVKVTTRAQLRDELTNRTTGGIYFTTLQKFGLSRAEKRAGAEHPRLSDRRNIIVIADEAHRSHYDDLDGYARHLKDALPNAVLIAFTGTPISFSDRNTREVFGTDIDIYDLSRAVEDGATVPVYFEPRLIKVGLTEEVSEETLDQAADEATTGLDDAERAKVEQAVAQLNTVYGAPERIATLATDIVDHWEARSEAMRQFISGPGKAMIVCNTREICAKLYTAITSLRSGWHDKAVDKGVIKVVYSGDASDKPPISEHVRRESQNKTIKERLRNPDDELQLVIVQNMMLTGYDSPPLHTLYLDRPLKGALLMQTLARVNRTFRGKEDGLLVAYAPLADNLSRALAEYTETDQEKKPVGKTVEEAVELTKTLIGQLEQLSSGYPWRKTMADSGKNGFVYAVKGLTNYLRSPHTPGNQVEPGEESLGDRFRRLSNQLARAWALCAGRRDQLAELRPAAGFFEETRKWMAKFDARERQAAGKPVPEDIERLLTALVAESTGTTGIVDIYEAAGMPKPSLSDLTPEFQRRTQRADNPHLAIEALRSLINEESTRVTRHNLVRQRAFSERIAELMRRYTNQQLTSAEVIAELIELAKEVAAEADRGKHFSPPLGTDELAFYDAVSSNESAVDLQGEDILAQIARELVSVMTRDVKTDWTVRDDVRAKLRSSVKRLLVKYKYPPDKQPEAIKLVIEQMETMAMRDAVVRASGR